MCKYEAFDDVPLKIFNFRLLQNRHKPLFVGHLLYVLAVVNLKSACECHKLFTKFLIRFHSDVTLEEWVVPVILHNGSDSKENSQLWFTQFNISHTKIIPRFDEHLKLHQYSDQHTRHRFTEKQKLNQELHFVVPPSTERATITHFLCRTR